MGQHDRFWASAQAEQVHATAVSRRRLLTAVAGAMGTVALAACGGQATGGASSNSATAATARAATSSAPATTQTGSASRAATSSAATSSAATSGPATGGTATSSAAPTASAAAPSAANGASLVWQVEYSGPVTEKQYRDFLTPFMQAHPSVAVEPLNVGGGDSDKIQKALTMAAAGTPIDVLGKITFIQPVARPGAVQPIQPFISRDKYDISGFNAGWLKTFGTSDGKLYSLPWGLGGNAMALIYNSNLLNAAGLKPPSQDWKNPWTWDDYREYAAKLTVKQGNSYQRVGTDVLGHWELTGTMQFGGYWVNEDATKAICDSPEMVEAVNQQLNIVLKDKSSSATPGVNFKGNNTDRFVNQEVAISYIIGSKLTTFTQPDDYKQPYVVATFPKGTYSSPDMDTQQLAIGANIKHPDDAWTLIKWLIEDGRYAGLVSRMPTLTKDATAWQKKAFAKVPESAGINVIVDSLAIARPQDPVRSIPKAAQWSTDIVGPLWKDLLAGKTTAQAGLTAAKSRLQAMLDS